MSGLTSGDGGQTQEKDEDRHPERGQPRHHVPSDGSVPPHAAQAPQAPQAQADSSLYLVNSGLTGRWGGGLSPAQSSLLTLKYWSENKTCHLMSEECMNTYKSTAQRCPIIPLLQVKILSCCIAKLLKVLHFNKIKLKSNKVCLFNTLLEWELY